jgi:hypothetical protein
LSYTPLSEAESQLIAIKLDRINVNNIINFDTFIDFCINILTTIEED